MSALGVYLLQQQILTSDQLREAEQSQALHGGRLGTNLIKRGLLELDGLAAHLSDVYAVPLPPADWLEHPEERAAQVLPMPLIRRFKLLPLALEKTQIHVAMLDPTDPVQLDFVATAAGHAVVPYVLPEVRLLYWLEIHLGIDRHPRYVNLIARSRQPGLLEEANPTGFRSGASTPPLKIQIGDECLTLDAENDDLPMLTASDIQTNDDALDLVDAAPDPKEANSGPATGAAIPRLPQSSAEVAALEAEIDGATDRDVIIRLALRIARVHARAAGLFLVRGGTVESYRGDGDLLAEEFRGVALPMLTESLFAQPAARLTAFRGEPPSDGIDGRILTSIGRAGVREVLVQPISIRGRVVNLLYVDNGPDPFGETSIAALQALCACVARAYERVILGRKSVAG